MGTESTGSPSNVEDEDDGMEDILTEDIITSMAGVISYKEPKSKEVTVIKTQQIKNTNDSNVAKKEPM